MIHWTNRSQDRGAGDWLLCASGIHVAPAWPSRAARVPLETQHSEQGQGYGFPEASSYREKHSISFSWDKDGAEHSIIRYGFSQEKHDVITSKSHSASRHRVSFSAIGNAGPANR